jgi:hypothetical protein
MADCGFTNEIFLAPTACAQEPGEVALPLVVVIYALQDENTPSYLYRRFTRYNDRATFVILGHFSRRWRHLHATFS